SEANKQIATFESSNPLLNKIWDAIVNTYRCINYNGYVVDCPHRERGGYGGDSHASLETALSIFDVAPLINKWTLDWNAAQYPTGLWPHTVPEFPSHKNKFSPGWGGFGMFLPWQFYKYHGDTVCLARAYPHIKKWMKFLESHTVDGILQRDSLEDRNSFGAFHGDWVAPYYGMNKDTRVDENSTNFFNNCFYLYELDMAKQIATLLGKQEDAKHFSKLYKTSKPIIHHQFYDTEEKWYANGEQPYQAFPLLIDLMPDSLRPEMEELMEYLIVEKNKGHLNTGMLGTYFMLEYLMKAGRGDLIYTMVNKKTFPGWGYMIENGATTIWEQWNGDNSQIHNCYLAIGKWFVQGLGGIQIEMEKPGLPKFIIKPDFIEELNYVDVSYETGFGKIASNWENKSNVINHKLEIPINVECLYKVPEMKNIEVSVNGFRVDNNQKVLRIDSGINEIKIFK
ncbi:MAG: alpha-L-rhamnosidase C-terminal domain-containing protein, partial [Draconibacterium sp.]|nr:alpha-L-rhamnosidase C-terminal domain-containing protein [Draconibacterium sp.]